MTIPTSHPRLVSLKTRTLLEKGVKDGITSLNGLIAHGRGEAFDYLLSEKTHDFAREAIRAAAATLLLAKQPVVSVNGNTTAIVPKEMVQLARLLDAPLEVNLFHPSEKRLQKIKKHLEKHGAKEVLLPEKECVIFHLDSPRKYVNSNGIFQADVVFVPLEDGDRTEALIKNGKKVITVDLNPLSRTAEKATITIVDNIIRAMPKLIQQVRDMKIWERRRLLRYLDSYNNQKVLQKAITTIRAGTE